MKLLVLSLVAVAVLVAAQIAAPYAGPAIALVAGLLGGAAGWRSRQPALDAAGAEAAGLRGRQAQSERTAARLATLEGNVSTLRHDLRGILSPALLTADRLAISQDPAAKRAGEVIVKTVERATARLAETRGDQELSVGPGPSGR